MPTYRLDTATLFRRVDVKRTVAELSWRQVAEQTGLSSSTFTRLRNGHAPDAHGLVALLMWTGNDLNEVALLVCGTCQGRPPKGYTCNACGTGAQQ